MSVKEIASSCLEKIIIVGGILLGIILMITGNIAIFAIFAIPIMSIDDKYKPYVLGAVFLYIFLNMIFGFVQKLKEGKNNN
jgi:hypothetical protein